ncbi:MAG: protein kinase [Acidobacteriia bacterium]|nr:protein kinase [Terriglobia bacterium]
MGEVYKAEDLKLGRIVAIKVLPDAARSDEKARKRLLQEARSASALNHPNIVTVHAIEQVGSAEGPLDLLVMEYLEGQNLSARVRDAPMDLPALLGVGVQVADALAAAHEAGLIHRDVKPSNILITARGHAKVLDFGLAKTVPLLTPVRDPEAETLTDEALTSEGTIVGTVAYMSPEQTRGEPLDARSDIFSLGCVLYEAATGTRPFRGSSVLAICREVAEVNPPAPSALRPELPPEFDLIVERALAKEKEHRFQSASEFAGALKHIDSPALLVVKEERRSDAFVGREPELRQLEEMLRLAVQGSGRMVFLTGEPGIGKTSLAGEILRRARGIHPAALAARGACVEQYGTGESYLPFLDALGSLLAGPGRERVLAVLRRLAPTWCLQLPAAQLSGVDLERMRREAIGATKERMLREMGDFLGAFTSSTPLVLLLEDLHWADPSSADLLRHLGQRISGQRLLLIGTLRQEDLEIGKHPLRNYIREMQGHRFCEQIALQSLAEEYIQVYLDARFAPNDFPAELAELIQSKTEGHPLFVASLAQFLAERGDIALAGDRWNLMQPVAEMDLEMPSGVQGMIRKKIEALGDAERRALEYASVEGQEFTSATASALLKLEDVALEEQLDSVEKVYRLIHTIGEEELPDGTLATRYRFAHALYQNFLYQGMVPKRRMLLHRQAGEALLKRYGSQAPRIAAQLATHFERGRDFARAVEYLIHMGDNAGKLYDNGIAVNHYTHALALVEKLPPAEQASIHFVLHQKRGSAYLGLGRLAEAEQDFTLMLEHARAMRDAGLECTALNALANLANYSRRPDDMGAWASEAMRVADRIGNQALRGESVAHLANFHLVKGELNEAGRFFDEALALARPLQHTAALLPALTFRGLNHFFRTEYHQAEALELEASDLASRVHDGFHLAISLFYLGLSRANQGRLSDALATLNQALEMARRNDNRLALARVPNGIGWVYRELHDLRRAAESDRACVEIARQTQTAEAEANALINLVYDYTYAGEPDLALGALRDVEPLIDRSPWNRWRFFEIRLQAGAAEFWLSQRKLDRANEHATRLLASATRYGVPKYSATAHQLLGEVFLAAGEHDRAAAELKTALDAIRHHPAPLIAWRIWASLARTLGQMGERQAARDAFAQSAGTVKAIASQLTTDGQREVFLNAPAIQEVVSGAAGGD